jgi:hypothetical protein
MNGQLYSPTAVPSGKEPLNSVNMIVNNGSLSRFPTQAGMKTETDPVSKTMCFYTKTKVQLQLSLCPTKRYPVLN